MDFAEAFSNINWLSVVVACIAAFIIGALWYSPLLFSKIWQKEVGLTDEDLKDVNMFKTMGTSFVLQFIAAILMDMFLGNEATLVDGIITGGIVGIGWVATSLGTNYLFSKKSLKLFFIDAGYFVVWFILIGLILGAW